MQIEKKYGLFAMQSVGHEAMAVQKINHFDTFEAAAHALAALRGARAWAENWNGVAPPRPLYDFENPTLCWSAFFEGPIKAWYAELDAIAGEFARFVDWKSEGSGSAPTLRASAEYATEAYIAEVWV